MMPDKFRSFKWILLAAALPLALVIAGCDDDDDDNNGPASPTLQVTSQVADPADEVVVQQVRSLEDGWIVIHEGTGDLPGDVIGFTAVPRGVTNDVAVDLTRSITTPENLVAMLHLDRGTPGVFEFPGADVPARNAAGDVVAVDFSVVPVNTAPLLSFVAQTADSLSTEVVADQAVVLGPSWIVAHEDDSGQPGAVIGFSHVGFGSNMDVLVPVDRPIESGETIHLMLHTDAGQGGVFEFPGPDAPTVVNGNPVVASAMVTVPAGLPAAILRFTAQGNEDFLVEVSPMQHRGRIVGGTGGQGDPTLTLNQGWRYQFNNRSAAAHPLELVDLGTTPAGDVVLLSQTDTGTLEGDAAVDWVESGNAFRFNLTPTLAASLEGYRCAVHPTTQRGLITVDVLP